MWCDEGNSVDVFTDGVMILCLCKGVAFLNMTIGPALSLGQAYPPTLGNIVRGLAKGCELVHLRKSKSRD